MTIGTGQVSLYDVITEHGGAYSNASLSNYYRGSGTLFIYGDNAAIPASGQISLSQFRGTSRYGYYPMYGTYYSTGSGAQYGYNSNGAMGGMSYNNRYRGSTIQYLIWNQYDGNLGFCLSTANVPQSYLNNIWLPTHGWVSNYGAFTYNGNFFGFTLWLVQIGTGTIPFNGSMQNIIIV